MCGVGRPVSLWETFLSVTASQGALSHFQEEWGSRPSAASKLPRPQCLHPAGGETLTPAGPPHTATAGRSREEMSVKALCRLQSSGQRVLGFTCIVRVTVPQSIASFLSLCPLQCRRKGRANGLQGLLKSPFGWPSGIPHKINSVFVFYPLLRLLGHVV